MPYPGFFKHSNKLQELVDALKNNIESAIQQNTQLDDFFEDLNPY
jgi:hypothetical protein